MNPLIIFGASTRAAAFSAIRAGFDPICGDMFADADLRAHATQMLDIPHYPRQLSEALQNLPASTPWIYTGGLENSPSEVDRVCRRHLLWGNAGSVLRRCRDPWLCASAMQAANLASLALRTSADPPPPDARWLMKPLKSAGGRDIKVWLPGTVALSEPHYFQRNVVGAPISGVYVAGNGWVCLLGITRQLVGAAELHAPAFGYCGSLFSAADPIWAPVREVVRRAGEVIATEFQLRGLFGIDFIDDGQTAWMNEVNPRYTSSMELIEYAYQQPLLQWHRAACEGTLTASQVGQQSPSYHGWVAKVILYANRVGRTPDLADQIPRDVSLQELPQLADIPVAQSEIVPGQPVFTCLGTGSQADDLRQGLIEHARELWKLFSPAW